jgi:hypothetical protein
MSEGDWPKYLRDKTLEAWMRRMDALVKLITERGHFSKEQANSAINDIRSITKEPIASWLRNELKKLRESEKIVGKAPVLTGETLSRLVIADLAMTMVEVCEFQPEENLMCLLQELLNVDRHRASQADKPSEAFQQAAQIDAQMAVQGKSIGVRNLAKVVSVDAGTISGWRNDPDYQAEVEMHKSVFSRLLADDPDFFNLDRLRNWPFYKP